MHKQIRNFTNQVKTSFGKYPIEMITTILISLVALVNTIYPLEKNLTLSIEKYTYGGIIIVYIMNSIFRKREWRILYYISWTPLLYLLVFKPDITTDTLFYGYIFLMILFFSVGWHRDNQNYAQTLLARAQYLLFAAGVSLLVYITIEITVECISTLFNVPDKLPHSFWQTLCSIGLLPILFLALSEKDRDRKESIFFKILFNYLLTPALFIYTLIFYAYGIQTIVKQELPKGTIAIMTMLFVTSGVIGKMYDELYPHKLGRIFYKYFNLLCIPVTAIYLLAVMNRISYYGLTPDRIILIIFGIVLIAFCFGFINKKSAHWLYYALLSAFLTGCVVFTPFFSAEKLINIYEGKGPQKQKNAKIVCFESSFIKLNIQSYTTLYILSSKQTQNDNAVLTNYEDGIFTLSDAKGYTVSYLLDSILFKKLEKQLTDIKFDGPYYVYQTVADSMMTVNLSADSTLLLEQVKYDFSINTETQKPEYKISDINGYMLLIR